MERVSKSRRLTADELRRCGPVLVALGFSNREIAGVLHVEEETQLAVAWATGAVLMLP